MLPERLEERFLRVGRSDSKPLLLLVLLTRLLEGDSPLIIVFTSSVDSTHRLTRLLQLCSALKGYDAFLFILLSHRRTFF